MHLLCINISFELLSGQLYQNLSGTLHENLTGFPLTSGQDANHAEKFQLRFDQQDSSGACKVERMSH